MKLTELNNDVNIRRAMREVGQFSNPMAGQTSMAAPGGQSSDVALAKNMAQNLEKEREMLRKQIQDTEESLREMRRRLAEIGSQ